MLNIKKLHFYEINKLIPFFVSVVTDYNYSNWVEVETIQKCGAL